MRQEDLEQYKIHFPHWARLTGLRRASVCLLSGDTPQEHVLRNAFMQAVDWDPWDGPDVINLGRDEWDLNQPGTRDFDVIVAMNVFMYSSDPLLWFGHVLSRCKWFWVQDPVCGQRGRGTELGDGPQGDGDSMRFSAGNLFRARIEDAYDLARHQDRIHRLVAYRLNVGDHVPYAMSYMAMLRGDL
jgi:hypothetical protein